MKLEINPQYIFAKLDEQAGKGKDPNEVTLPSGDKIYVYPHDRSNSWAFRVKVSDRQAVLGFPKFFQIGIGFEKEQDGNTNLPSTCSVAKIHEHIKHNSEGVSDEICLKAIRMVKVAASKWMAFEQQKKNEKAMAMFPELRGANGKMLTLSQFRKACYIKQQAYAGDYNVVFGLNKQTQEWKYFFSLSSRKGLREAVQNLYWFLLGVGNGADVFQYHYYGLGGANFAHNKAALPNKWTSDLLHVHNFIAPKKTKKPMGKSILQD